jgi:general secretion pathway protein B
VSLILDALRRADSERERGSVPGLHAQPVPMASSPAPASAGRRHGVWLAAVAGAVLAAWLVWTVLERQTARQPTAPAVATAPPATAGTPAPPAPGPAPRSAAADAMPQGAPAAASPATPAAPAGASGVPQPVAEPAPWPSAESSRKPAVADTTDTGIAGTAAARPATPPAATAPAAPLPTREQLPPDIRAQLPPLAVGGSIYSTTPGARSVIIDGRILRENDRLNADLAVEQIRPKAAVLRFKGHRFELPLQ